jgi:hypothetical protein
MKWSTNGVWTRYSGAPMAVVMAVMRHDVNWTMACVNQYSTVVLYAVGRCDCRLRDFTI